jgi:hypothetical protein
MWVDGAGQREGSELLGLWTLSIVWNSKYLETTFVENWIFFNPQVCGERQLLCWVP